MTVRLLVLSTVLLPSCMLTEGANAGIFSLVNLQQERLCMAPEGPNSAGASSCGGQEIGPAQLWVHDNSLRIVGLADRRCLDYDFNKKIVFMHVCHEGTSQRWSANDVDLTIRHEWVDLCLELDSSQTIKIAKCNSRSRSQKFLKVWSEWKGNAPTAREVSVLPNGSRSLIIVAMIAGSMYLITVTIRCLREPRSSDLLKDSREPLLIDVRKENVEQMLDNLNKMMADVSTRMTQLATAIDVQGAEDSSSDCTVGSWTHVAEEPCCFLPGTFLKKVTDVGHEMTAVQSLFQGAQVLSANGTAIEVLRPPQQHQVEAIIRLQAGPSCLVVSPDHRILIPGNKTVQARDLEEGGEVIVDGTPAKLTSVKWLLEPTIVLKISFTPDLPVAGCLLPPPMWSKGSRQKAVVRRGLKKPGQGGDRQTFPDTEPPLTP